MLENGDIFIFGPLKWGSTTFMPESVADILGPTCRRRITLASRLAYPTLAGSRAKQLHLPRLRACGHAPCAQ
jgi:hypothetical protein